MKIFVKTSQPRWRFALVLIFGGLYGSMYVHTNAPPPLSIEFNPGPYKLQTAVAR